MLPEDPVPEQPTPFERAVVTVILALLVLSLIGGVLRILGCDLAGIARGAPVPFMKPSHKVEPGEYEISYDGFGYSLTLEVDGYYREMNGKYLRKIGKWDVKEGALRLWRDKLDWSEVKGDGGYARCVYLPLTKKVGGVWEADGWEDSTLTLKSKIRLKRVETAKNVGKSP